MIPVESLLDEIEQARAAAVVAGQFGAAVAAIKEKGVLSGKRVERSERGAPGDYDWIENASAEELRGLASGELDIESYRRGDDADVADRTATTMTPLVAGRCYKCQGRSKYMIHDEVFAGNA